MAPLCRVTKLMIFPENPSLAITNHTVHIHFDLYATYTQSILLHIELMSHGLDSSQWKVASPSVIWAVAELTCYDVSRDGPCLPH